MFILELFLCAEDLIEMDKVFSNIWLHGAKKKKKKRNFK